MGRINYLNVKVKCSNVDDRGDEREGQLWCKDVDNEVSMNDNDDFGQHSVPLLG